MAAPHEAVVPMRRRAHTVLDTISVSITLGTRVNWFPRQLTGEVAFSAASWKMDRGDSLLDCISIDWRCDSHGGKGDGDDVEDLHIV